MIGTHRQDSHNSMDSFRNRFGVKHLESGLRDLLGHKHSIVAKYPNVVANIQCFGKFPEFYAL